MRGDFADAVAAPFGDIKVTVRVDSDSCRFIELSSSARGIEIAGGPAPGVSEGATVGENFSDGMILKFSVIKR